MRKVKDFNMKKVQEFDMRKYGIKNTVYNNKKQKKGFIWIRIRLLLLLVQQLREKHH